MRKQNGNGEKKRRVKWNRMVRVVPGWGELLNVEDDRVAAIVFVGGDVWKLVLGAITVAGIVKQ